MGASSIACFAFSGVARSPERNREPCEGALPGAVPSGVISARFRVSVTTLFG
ncbi:hypothetical protein EV192_107352 [Actinocrispum wychmicini]|uniref:Uncharacterized protein n=1 Tax=Actinocrispum wychmicini TaxID=1213861 RepID=A0A4R2JHR1_9PSEU|nr:hypothetical protein EV192_107352 [Actinocrispum wychmicini]